MLLLVKRPLAGMAGRAESRLILAPSGLLPRRVSRGCRGLGCRRADNETAVVEAAVLVAVSFPVGNQGETRVFECNQQDHWRNGQTALHRVVAQGCPAPLFAVLISAGSNVNAKDDEGNTQLLIASTRGLCGVLELLLAAGADVAAKNKARTRSRQRCASTEASIRPFMRLRRACSRWSRT